MADVAVHQLTHRAKVAIAELYREFKQRLTLADYALLPPSFYRQLSDEYERRLNEIIREGTEETTADRYVRVKCPKCGREANIAGDVERWTCICSSIERWAFQTMEM